MEAQRVSKSSPGNYQDGDSVSVHLLSSPHSVCSLKESQTRPGLDLSMQSIQRWRRGTGIGKEAIEGCLSEVGYKQTPKEACLREQWGRWAWLLMKLHLEYFEPCMGIVVDPSSHGAQPVHTQTHMGLFLSLRRKEHTDSTSHLGSWCFLPSLLTADDNISCSHRRRSGQTTVCTVFPWQPRQPHDPSWKNGKSEGDFLSASLQRRAGY